MSDTVVNGNKIGGTTIVAGVIALAAIAAGLFFGLAVTNHLDSASTPILTVILGTLASTGTGLLASAKVDSISHKLQNGLIEDKVNNAIDNKQVVTRDGPVVTSATQALIRLLEANGIVDPNKTQAVINEVEKGVSNGR